MQNHADGEYIRKHTKPCRIIAEYKTNESEWPGAMKVGGPATHFNACGEIRVHKCAEPCMHVFGLSTLLNKGLQEPHRIL